MLYSKTVSEIDLGTHSIITTDGSRLYAIGNRFFLPGDIVYTDGTYAYGLQKRRGGGGLWGGGNYCLYYDPSYGGLVTIDTRTFQKKLLCNTPAMYFVGGKNGAYAYTDAFKKLYNLFTGEELRQEPDIYGGSNEYWVGSVPPFDACVDVSGNFLDLKNLIEYKYPYRNGTGIFKNGKLQKFIPNPLPAQLCVRKIYSDGSWVGVLSKVKNEFYTKLLTKEPMELLFDEETNIYLKREFLNNENFKLEYRIKQEDNIATTFVYFVDNDNNNKFIMRKFKKETIIAENYNNTITFDKNGRVVHALSQKSNGEMMLEKFCYLDGINLGKDDICIFNQEGRIIHVVRHIDNCSGEIVVDATYDITEKIQLRANDIYTVRENNDFWLALGRKINGYPFNRQIYVENVQYTDRDICNPFKHILGSENQDKFITCSGCCKIANKSHPYQYSKNYYDSTDFSPYNYRIGSRLNGSPIMMTVNGNHINNQDNRALYIESLGLKFWGEKQNENVTPYEKWVDPWIEEVAPNKYICMYDKAKEITKDCNILFLGIDATKFNFRFAVYNKMKLAKIKATAQKLWGDKNKS